MRSPPCKKNNFFFRKENPCLPLRGALIAVSIALASFQGGSTYKVETRYPVPGDGGFDYVTIDSAARRLLSVSRHASRRG